MNANITTKEFDSDFVSANKHMLFILKTLITSGITKLKNNFLT